ncbi:MAG: GatB/YqeY domain-containing protein [Xanthomonadales bacterium]|nr:GatB/YqeY domain-containing protein [Xanthomonadales bacterium]MDH4018507.1 GatB/YqeY domain-containing protein [Xanthomonadales bacterium]
MTLPLNTLKSQILEDVKSAMRARDQKRLTALRLITAAIKQIEVDKRIEMDDQAVLAVLDKMVKQRRDSLEQYQAAGRDDLAAQEKFELDLIAVYLPEALGEDELAELIKQAVVEAGASSIRDMGAVMNILRGQVQGRADMKAVSGAVKAQLGA